MSASAFITGRKYNALVHVEVCTYLTAKDSPSLVYKYKTHIQNERYVAKSHGVRQAGQVLSLYLFYLQALVRTE